MSNSNSIYCSWRYGPPIVIIGCSIEEHSIKVVDSLIDSMGLRIMNPIKPHVIVELIGAVNRINTIFHQEHKPRPINLFMELIGTYEYERYSYVSILRNIKKMEVLLGCPNLIELSSNKAINDIELNNKVIYRSKEEWHSASLIVSHAYALTIQEEYTRHYKEIT